MKKDSDQNQTFQSAHLCEDETCKKLEKPISYGDAPMTTHRHIRTMDILMTSRW